jgi:hypothetical protein
MARPTTEHTAAHGIGRPDCAIEAWILAQVTALLFNTQRKEMDMPSELKTETTIGGIGNVKA